jgi:hypothetical protein
MGADKRDESALFRTLECRQMTIENEPIQLEKTTTHEYQGKGSDGRIRRYNYAA